MPIAQILLILVTGGIITATYMFGAVVKEKSTTEQVALSNSSQLTTFKEATYIETSIANLQEESAANFQQLVNQLNNATGHVSKAELLDSLLVLADQNQLLVIHAIYLKQKAVLLNKEEIWKNSANEFLMLSYQDHGMPSINQFLTNNAIEGFKKIIELNPDNVEAKINLATVYVDATNETMQGITLLLDIIKNDPNNPNANLILGRYGILSGQFDKAVKRLTLVIQNDAKNAEAYFYLAEAYNGLGQKDLAIEHFEKCKTLVSNPDFALEIDNYIKKIRNS